ncbi:hypothetical protein [Novosphingobium sp. KACC 22771]|uniref:hypothetical protein n=1 Tax=Novosphingobium sp. KACC 22771 TaxID=3025670 RepID=UPI002366FF03|nr:hypothetical protein [Novosphingobium sp. KACC 22771]WDF72860.1 hypothetical protein PQ467_02120 [Novosphingobium sp. KACC 22771]
MIDLISRRLAIQSASNAAAALRAAQTRAIVPTQIGAVGDGLSGSADQGGFDAALLNMISSRSAAPTGVLGPLEYQNGIMIEPGIYDAGDLTLTDGSLRLVARIPWTVVIRIPDNKYFCTQTGQPFSIVCDGIIFVGGKGAYKSTRNAANVINLCQFTRCLFYNYSECAISNNSSDSPYLKVKDCFFAGKSTSSTIGIAWGGYVDQMVIEDNSFGPNEYHIAVGPYLSGSFHIRRNDFIGQTSVATKADIWLKPNVTNNGDTNGGHGSLIEANKFGAEGQIPGQCGPRILIATEDTATGIDRATYRPGQTDIGYLSGLRIQNNRVASITSPNVPFMRSYISNLRGVRMAGDIYVGGQYTHVIEWPNGRSSNFGNTNSTFEFDEASGSVPIAFSSHLCGRLRDWACYWPGDANRIELYPVGDSAKITCLLNGVSPVMRTTMSGVTRVRTADTSGCQDWDLVTVSSLGGGMVAGFSAAGLPNGEGTVFLELALKKAPVRSVSQVTVEVFNYANSVVALQRTVSLPASGGRFIQPVNLPVHASPSTWQVRVKAPTIDVGNADQFITGDWIVNAGSARIGRDLALAQYPLLPRNRTMIGGGVNAWPMGWSGTPSGGLSGLTITVNAVGADQLGHFIDLQFAGTTTNAGKFTVYCEAVKSVPATSGQTWTYYMPMALTAGNLTGLIPGAGFDGTSGAMLLNLLNYNSAGTLLADILTAFTPTATMASYGNGAITLTNGATAYILPSLMFTFASGVATNFTVRIYTPSLRRVN